MKKYFAGIVLGLVIFGSFGSAASAQPASLAQLVELFISLGIIKPEKAASARSAVQSVSTTPTSVDQDPNDNCSALITRDLTIGSKGADVKVLQNELGIFPGSAYFGPVTQAAVKTFQSTNGIPATGFFGGITREKFNSIYGCVIETPPTIPPVPNTTVCTQDVKKCEDGSYVSRNADNQCQFDVCESSATQPKISSLSASVIPVNGEVIVYGSGFNTGTKVLIDGNDYGLEYPATGRDTSKVKSFIIPAILNNCPKGATCIFGGLSSVGKHKISVTNGDKGVRSNEVDLEIKDGNSNTSASATIVGTPTLALSYDSANKESQLTATFDVSVTAGSKDAEVFIGSADLGFVNQNGGVQINANSNRTTLYPLVKNNQVGDSFGRKFAVVSANTSATFRVTGVANPKEFFAGNYYAVIRQLYFNTNDSQGTLGSIYVSGKTNSKTIIGETSPYITSVTNTVAPGGMLTITGQRLNFTSVWIDGIAINAYIQQPTSGFFVTIPSTTTVGNHSIVLKDSNGQASNPVGFNVSGSTTQTSPSATIIGSPTLELTYDSANKESQLTATFNAYVTAGDSDVSLYTTIGGIGFFNQNGGNGSSNSVKYRVNVNQGEKTDAYGRSYTIIPAGKTIPIAIVLTGSPKQMFAGSYYAKLTQLYLVGPDANNLVILPVPSNQTNSKTIIGETSPYITSVTNQISAGQTMTIQGQRLIGTIFIDGTERDPVGVVYSSGGSAISFTFPTLTTGQHWLQVVNTTTGASNSLNFTVSGSTSPQPSITVLSPNGGEVWQPGQRVQIKWQTTGTLQNADTQVDIMDDRIPNHSAISLFGSVPALNYATLLSSLNGVYTYGYDFLVPSNFNSTLTSQYQNIFGGNYYKVNVYVTEGGTTVQDKSNYNFSITAPQTASCTDSDGGQNPNIGGMADGRVNGLGSYFNDSSVGSNGGQCSGDACTSVAEGYCTSDGKVSNTLMSCSTGYSVNGACATKPAVINRAPVINSFTGPTSLTTGQSGTWTASASDSDGDTVNYGFFWGDNGTDALPNRTSGGTASMSHTFNSPGTYTIILGVSDIQYSVTKQVTVTVTAPSSVVTPSITVISPNGGETLTIGSNYTIRWSEQGISNGEYIHIMLAEAGGNDSAYIKSWLPAGIKEYVWNVSDFYPSVVGTNWKISVKTSSGSPRDVSDSTYTFAGPVVTNNPTSNLGSVFVGLEDVLKLVNLLKN